MSVLNAQDPMHRKLAMRAAEPVSDHTTACLAFLARVSSVHITGGTKKEYEITVHLSASVDDPEASATSFTITRTAKEFETIQKAVHDHANLHKDLTEYDVPPCALCEQFKKMKPIHIGTFEGLESGRKAIAQRLSFMVKGAAVPPTTPGLHCDGLVSIPSGLAKFLLRGVDQTKL